MNLTHGQTVDSTLLANELVGQLDEICETIKSRLADADALHLLDSIKQLQEGGRLVAQWARHYDYNNVPANGYWSLLRIGVKLGQIIIDKYAHVEKPKADKNLTNLLDYALTAIKVLKVLREDSVNESKEVSFDASKPTLYASSLSYFVDLFGLLLSMDNEKVGAAYGNFCGFWLCPQSRYAMTMLVSSLSLLKSNTMYDGLKSLVDPNHRGIVFAELIKKADIAFVKRFGNLLENNIYCSLLPTFLYGRSPKIAKNIYIDRQNRWLLSPLNRKVVDTIYDNDFLNRHRHKKDKIRCKVMRALDQSTPVANGKIIIHCHGGGFILGSPESNEVYLRDWVFKLPGVTIISIDYTLAPEAQFPVALQEILDVYIWLTSGSPEVEEKLETHVDSIVLVGDSAGANLLTALCMVLVDMRKTDPRCLISLPKSLISLYAPFNLSLLLSPSMVLASCDSLISAGVMLSCFEAYIPNFYNSADHNHHHLITYNDSLMSLFDDLANLNIGEITKKLFRYVKDVFTGSKSMPWYRAEKQRLRVHIDRLFEITSNPYLSPLFYDDFESLSSIDLSIVALHFDPFLDDNITMAKKWRGNVTLDVIDGLQHAFLNMLPFIQEAKDANEICVQRIRTALGT